MLGTQSVGVGRRKEGARDPAPLSRLTPCCGCRP